MEFERILSATGPYQGHLLRPSDRTEPKKIAWLQCVGSRDLNRCDHSYCSSVCCMYAIKEAVIAKEHAGDGLDCAVFFMDMRTFGKDYELYYNKARDERGIRFIRSRIHTIDPVLGSDDLVLQYSDEEGTSAFEHASKVPREVAQERHRELMGIQRGIMRELLEAQVGSDVQVLVDQAGPGGATGRLWSQAPEIDGRLLINDGSAPAASLIEAEITEAHPYDLVGRVVPVCPDAPVMGEGAFAVVIVVDAEGHVGVADVDDEQSGLAHDRSFPVGRAPVRTGCVPCFAGAAGAGWARRGTHGPRIIARRGTASPA